MSNFLILAITFGFVWITMGFIPYLTRRTDLFGITIPISLYDRSDFRKMRQQYMLTLLGIGLLYFLILTISSFFLSKQGVLIGTYIILFFYLLSSFLLYLPFHFKAKKIKAQEAWQETYPQKTIIDLHFRREKLTFSNWYFLFPLGFIIANIVLLTVFRDDMPSKVPVHYGLDGKVTYAAATGKGIYLPLVIQVFLLLLFLGMNMMIRQTKQQTDAGQPDQSKRQNILFRRRWSRWIIITSVLLSALFFFLQLSIFFESLQPFIPLAILIIVGFICLSVLFLSFKTGQGGSRIQTNAGTSQHIMNSEEDRHWKLGQIYFNRADPSIFVEKRFGVGWTNNWAHPASWLLIFLLITVVLLIVLLFT